jgi:hypothetical protein
MAISVSYGDDAGFNALCYGFDYHPNTLSYLENSVNNISNTLTTAGSGFMADVKVLQEQLIGNEAMRLAKAAVNKVSNLFQIDCIKSIWELPQLQNAPIAMQRWIMAEPTVREKFHNQRCDGYSGTYVDMAPSDIGKNHYDWRRVMHGMVTIDEEGYEKTVHYLDDLVEGDRELRLDEKIDILNTWEVVADLMKYGSNDPTSVWDEKL